MKRGTRVVAEFIGRLVAVAAVIVGGVLISNLFNGGVSPEDMTLVVAAGILSLIGGVLYLIGLDRWSGGRAIVARAVGWLLFTTAFQLPTSLTIPLTIGSILATPAIPNWAKPAPDPQAVETSQET